LFDSAGGGNRVEIQNYIDNTGVQVADVVVGFAAIEKMTLEDIKSLDSSCPLTCPFITPLGPLHQGGALSRRRDRRRFQP
jgi:hypothetical protein